MCVQDEGGSARQKAGGFKSKTLTEAPECLIEKKDHETSACPSPQTIVYCMQTQQAASHLPPWLSLPLSPPLFVTVSVQTISPCILNEYFSVLSPSVYKSTISKDLFYSLRPCFFLFLPELPILCFVTVKVPQSLRTLLIHTNDCPLFDVIENAYTSCWEEKGGKKRERWETRSGESIELKWNYFSWGRKTLCSLRY